ncbi:hypothetical protein [Sulfitobacter sp. UBA1132]|uniref:hypothetical protein n=1 Tax=Sulfitobacter sp. UBA1132 TaxID=1947582 RepID=UPI00257B7C29|nr:hypothetical protein [Sulfitobacter sp. UBA1132]
MPAKVGDIFKFVTEKAIGHETRDKYHVAIALSKGAMLFISSDPFEGAMKIDRNDWAKMPKEESYISCSGLLRYTKDDLEGVTPVPAGRLSDDCLRRLEGHVASSYTLEIREIDIILTALKDYAGG